MAEFHGVQCFDATDFGEVRGAYAKTHVEALIEKAKLPIWDRASCTYRLSHYYITSGSKHATRTKF